MDNAVEQEYTAWPDRLYLIGVDGRIRFKSEAGPFVTVRFRSKEIGPRPSVNSVERVSFGR